MTNWIIEVDVRALERFCQSYQGDYWSHHVCRILFFLETQTWRGEKRCTTLLHLRERCDPLLQKWPRAHLYIYLRHSEAGGLKAMLLVWLKNTYASNDQSTPNGIAIIRELMLHDVVSVRGLEVGELEAKSSSAGKQFNHKNINSERNSWRWPCSLS